MEVSLLIGKTLSSAKMNEDKDEIIFTTTEGENYKMYHSQDCCESVLVEDIAGDLSNLIDTPILVANEISNTGDAGGYDTCTWTFYNFATIKGYVTIRWYGTSNGYYSETVDFEKINP